MSDYEATASPTPDPEYPTSSFTEVHRGILTYIRGLKSVPVSSVERALEVLSEPPPETPLESDTPSNAPSNATSNVPSNAPPSEVSTHTSTPQPQQPSAPQAQQPPPQQPQPQQPQPQQPQPPSAPTPLDTDTVIATINARIADHGFKIARKYDDTAGELCYIFTNTEPDPVSKLATGYSVAELDFLKQLIDDIVAQPGRQYSVGRVNAYRKLGEVANRTLKQSDYQLTRFVDDGWLEEDRDHVYLSPRAVAELASYLLDRHGASGDVVRCSGCDDIVMTSGMAVAGDPERFFHPRCFAVFSRSSSVAATPFGPVKPGG
ncbi:hypothetical protein DICA2_D19284 [Diutina catenulata]